MESKIAGILYRSVTNNSNLEFDEIRKRQLFLLFVLPGFLILPGFGLSNILAGRLFEGTFDLVVTLQLVVSVLCLRVMSDGRPIYRASALVLGVLFGYLVVLGGSHGERTYWLFCYPLLMFFMMGKTEGAIWTLSLFLFMLVTFYVPGAPWAHVAFDYAPEMKTRLLAAYLLVMSMAFLSEAARRMFHDGMQERERLLTEEKEKLEIAKRAAESANLALQESEEYHRTLFEKSPIAIVLQDFSEVQNRVDAIKAGGVGDIRAYLESDPEEVSRLAESIRNYRVNQAAVTLYDAGSVDDMRRNLKPFMPIDDRQHFIEQIVAFTGGKNWYEGEGRNLTLNGDVIDVIVRKTVIQRGEHGLSKVLVSIVDITDLKHAHRERKQLETQLHQAQKLESLGTLAGGIAHDFNNILMGIQGNVSLSLEFGDGADKDRERLQAIASYVEDATDLTRQLLGFARGGKYEIVATDINQLIQKSAGLFGRTRKEIEIETDFQDDIWTVDVDQGQLEQVLLNLFVNAWQAMPGGGRLYIATQNVSSAEVPLHGQPSDVTDYAKISVADTGVGMDDATKARIFDPFFTTKEKGRGTGLGLASAYGIIQNHNGVISCRSRIGQGTEFDIYLPASRRSARQRLEASDRIHTGTGKILIVDDEPMVLEVGHQMLTHLGYTTVLARNGAEAIDAFMAAEGTIDLVILDLIMPNMNGSTLYDRLKQLDPTVNVLLSSGYSRDGHATEILERGCDGFIQKPFNLKQLSEKVQSIVWAGDLPRKTAGALK